MSAQRIAIVPSARLALGLCAVHCAAAGALWLAPVPVAAQAALSIAIAASFAFYLARDAALRTGDAIVALEIREEGEVSLRTRRGEWLECELLGSSFVSSRLTIVNLRPQGRRRLRHVILVPGNVDDQDFRRLRTWMRWAAHRRTETP